MSYPNTTHDSPTRGPARPMPYVVSGILLAVAIIFPLAVPMYAHADPHLFSFPFFFWYQMLWVPICAILIGICYKLMTTEDKRRRAVLQDQAGRRGRHDAGGEAK
ncbi:hypothetical protein QO003_002943 [Arthrobacter silviterrae]|nr:MULTISPECIES: DUF3311 domain-containing protein [Arthrobacter]MCU6481223.1 DUF3311 domain-containing protein [Arthrobacter sp. A2-55]MDQ0278640.1 hypothetical protein [Arthrobacter silviterrae]